LLYAAGTAVVVPSSVVLAEGVLRAMFLTRLKTVVAGLLLAATLVGIGFGLLWQPALQADPDGKNPPSPPPAARGDALADGDTWQPRTTLTGFGSSIAAVVFAPDGKTLAVVERDGKVHLWETDKDQGQVKIKTRLENLTSAAFAPDGKSLVVAGGRPAAATVVFIDVKKRQETRSVGALTDTFAHVGFTANGKQLVCTSFDRSFTRLDFPSPDEPRASGGQGTIVIRAVALSADGSVLATAS
jgi:hypothetical protein